MARTAATLTRRRAWLPFFFLVCVAVWYRRNHPRPSSPTWAVADFQIKEYRTKDQHQANNAGSFLNRDHPSYRIEDYRQEIEEIRNRPAFQQQQLSYDELQDRVQQFIQWDRPWTDHWPAWHDYDNTGYDPNRWEGLSRQYEFFVNNSVQQIEYDGSLAEPYLPYPDYNSARWKKRWNGKFVQCHGPRGETFWESDAMESVVKGYQFNSDTFPIETVGSASALGLDQSTCFDRYSRYEPYGLADDPKSPGTVDWKRVKWGALQESCFEMNMDRYAADARLPTSLRPSRRMKQSPDPLEDDGARLRAGFHGKRYKERTAILIRTWEGYEYRENDIQAIRALVTETSLMTGGEYQVFLFVNIKQREANIYEDEAVYRELLRKTVPKELRDIAILWTERILEEWYPNVGDWQVYWMQFMPLQWFSKLHPEFDYIWNWETDARYIGNHYHFFEQIAKFARNTPRKHMWERNSRFFFPDSWNGDYDAFLADTDEQIINASSLGLIDEPVWGPRPYAPFQYPLGPLPPHKAEEDNFEWGVGEDADLITLQPIWDPAETEWSYRNHIWNFIPEVRPHFTPENGNADGFDHPGFPTIPRRVFINTVVRFSKRMLHVMHLENLQGRAMQAEMWPATVALQHGLKAVYAPHPIWSDRKWPAWYAEAVFNADDGIPARWGQQLDSPYNHDREANFGGWSWYYRSVFPHMLFRKWLGWKAKDWGWDEDQAKQTELEQKIEIATKIGASLIDIDGFRMCLPGILLHPVKNVHEAADGG